MDSLGAALSEVNVLLQLAGFGYQMIGAENINGWIEGSFDNVGRAVTLAPQWDTDGIFMNYIVHPDMGATFYLIARNQGVGILGSWLASTLGSLFWEYYYEAFYEIPAANDLLVTSNVGSLIGELSWQGKSHLLKSNRIDPRACKEVRIVLVDPWNVVEGTRWCAVRKRGRPRWRRKGRSMPRRRADPRSAPACSRGRPEAWFVAKLPPGTRFLEIYQSTTHGSGAEKPFVQEVA